jgi:hypothetical protein
MSVWDEARLGMLWTQGESLFSMALTRANEESAARLLLKRALRLMNLDTRGSFSLSDLAHMAAKVEAPLVDVTDAWVESTQGQEGLPARARDVMLDGATLALKMFRESGG